MTTARPIALTMGDPAGVGPELALMAWRALKHEGAPFFILADPARLARLSDDLALGVPVVAAQPGEAAALFVQALPCVPLNHRVEARRGSETDARATIESIERAVALVHDGAARAVVTNPIAKDSLYAAGFRHPGHTEFLGELATRHWGVVARPVMMIWSRLLATVPVTIHIALERVKAELTRELIVETAEIVARDLRARFGIAAPRLALCGLNPHAGESGTMGREEIDIIIPAIEELRAKGIAVTGPHPADTLFHERARATYDAALGMYHDQALIPIKTLAFDEGVNVTLGLPFVRTSPDHGTAFDIAGQGVANPSSLIEAIRLAARLSA